MHELESTQKFWPPSDLKRATLSLSIVLCTAPEPCASARGPSLRTVRRCRGHLARLYFTLVYYPSSSCAGPSRAWITAKGLSTPAIVSVMGSAYILPTPAPPIILHLNHHRQFEATLPATLCKTTPKFRSRRVSTRRFPTQSPSAALDHHRSYEWPSSNTLLRPRHLPLTLCATARHTNPPISLCAIHPPKLYPHKCHEIGRTDLSG